MEILKHSVGIDIDKKTFKACICLIDNSLQTKAVASKTFDNTDSGFRLFEDWSQKYCLRNPSPVSYVMEATGVYHESLSWHLHGKGLPVSIVLPTKAKNYMKSLGQHTKNDPMDAKGLAMMGAQQHLEVWSPPSMELYSLKRLTRHYEALQQERTRLLGRMESASHGMHQPKVLGESLARMMETIEAEIAIIKTEIKSAISDDPVLSQKAPLLTSVKGVGLMTAAVIMAETAGFALIASKKQLVSYAGYDVVENRSGSRVGKTRISKKGNSHIRRAMHMPALNAVRYGVGSFAQLYERVYARKDAKMAGYVAVQRKLLMLLHTLWEKDECYDEGFYTAEQSSKSSETILGDSYAEASFGGKKKAEPYEDGSAQDDLFQCESTLSASFG